MSRSDHTDRFGLERFDAVEVPDLWAEIVRRADAGGHDGSNVVAMRRSRGWYLAAAASFVALIGGLVVVTQLRDDEGVTPVDEPAPVADATGCGDASDLDAIVEVLSSGMPTYDYQPAIDVEALIGANDVVVRGRLTEAVRGTGPAPADLGDLGLTTISISSVAVLSGETSASVDGFDTASLWADRSQDDPLAEPVTFDRLEVIAVLSQRDDVPSGWTPDIEGWFVACEGGPAVGVIETPTFLDLSSLDALEAQITGVEPTTTTTEPRPSESTVPEAIVDERWNPACVDQLSTGIGPSTDAGLDEFGPLGAVPGLDIVLPTYRPDAQAAPAAVNVAVGRVDGGTAVLARPYEGAITDTYILSIVEDDGSVRWRRCTDGAFAGSLLTSPGAELLVVAEYTQGAESDGPVWHVFDVATGRDTPPLDVPDELQTVTANGRYALFTLSGERTTTATDEMRLLDLATGELVTIPYPDVTDVAAFRFDFQIVDPDGGAFRILQRTSDGGVAVSNVWIDGEWRSDSATVLDAAPIRAVMSFDERGWEGRNGLGEVVWSRPDLLDIRQEGFLGELSGAVTIVNGCLEQGEGGCIRGSLFGLDTATGDTLWERSGLRAVSAVGDGFAIITNDASDGWEMIDTLTGVLVAPSQQWAGIEPFEQQCCGGGDFVWVGRSGGIVFAVNHDHIRVWYPLGDSSETIDAGIVE